MENWDISQDSQINDQSPYQSLEPLVWNNSMGSRTESLLINEHFSVYSDFSDKEHWTQFLADGNEDEYCAAKKDDREEKAEVVQVQSPMAASSHSGFDEQQSEVLCAEEQLAELSDDSGSRKSSEGEIVDSKSKKRKTRSGERGPKYAFKTRSETDVLEDGFKWRKYGKKTIKSSPHPRSYYRCSDSNCEVKKRVERDPTDNGLLITTYEGKHNHESPSVIYYVGKPTILQHPGSKPAIVLVNAGLYS